MASIKFAGKKEKKKKNTVKKTSLGTYEIPEPAGII
jgi:hypothetical protein